MRDSFIKRKNVNNRNQKILMWIEIQIGWIFNFLFHVRNTVLHEVSSSHRNLNLNVNQNENNGSNAKKAKSHKFENSFPILHFSVVQDEGAHQNPSYASKSMPFYANIFASIDKGVDHINNQPYNKESDSCTTNESVQV